MSGPKLSEYELEQLRKAELERIQREIENLHANILRTKKIYFLKRSGAGMNLIKWSVR